MLSNRLRLVLNKAKAKSAMTWVRLAEGNEKKRKHEKFQFKEIFKL